MPYEVDKAQLLDTEGRPLTQSLFLEPNYNTKYAVFTMKDDDHEFRGKLYPSLRKLFLEMEDVTEYQFANTYLLGWSHWKRLNNNQVLAHNFEEWREELELKIRASAIKSIIEASVSDSGGFQAAKWLADRGWDKRGAGRPSKAEVERHKRVEEKLDNEFGADIARLSDYKAGG